MNLSATRALLWEYYRLARRPVALLVLSSCSLAALYRTALDGMGARRDALVFTSLFVTLCLVYLLTLLTCRADGMTLGFERRLYRLPLPTTELVLSRWIPALLTAALAYGATALFMRLVFDAAWPLGGPVLILVSVIGSGLAIVWAVGARPYLLTVIGIPLFGLLLYWLQPFLKVDPQRSLGVWKDFGSTETLGLLALLGGSMAVAIVGVQHDRSTLGSRARALPKPSTRRARTVRFRSARDAQLFMEWREKGRWMPIVCAGSLVSAVLAGGFPTYETGPVLRHALVAFALVLIALPPVSGFLHGWFDLKGSIATLDRLRATRPLSDRQLARVLLFSAARAVLVGWCAALLVLVTLFLLTGLLGDREKTLLVVEGIFEAIAHVHLLDLTLFFAVLLSWAVAGSGSTLALVGSGRDWVIAIFAVGPYAWILLGLAAERLLGSSLVLEILPWGAGALLAAIPLATAVAVVTGWRRGLEDARSLARAFVPYLILNALLIARSPFLQRAFAPDEPWLARSAALLVPAALCAVLLPRFLAPLTLGANRHR
ncbi:MAG: hypothetical protein AAGA81_03175 [Acidobacteriota bacterium]